MHGRKKVFLRFASERHGVSCNTRASLIASESRLWNFFPIFFSRAPPPRGMAWHGVSGCDARKKDRQRTGQKGTGGIQCSCMCTSMLPAGVVSESSNCARPAASKAAPLSKMPCTAPSTPSRGHSRPAGPNLFVPNAFYDYELRSAGLERGPTCAWVLFSSASRPGVSTIPGSCVERAFAPTRPV